MFAAEARKSGIRVLPPCVNASAVEFIAEPPKKAEAHGAIRYALAALKNIGASAVETIVESRNAKGSYKSLSDFAARINTKAVNKRALETLAAAGAFDAFEPSRALVYANVEGMIALANRISDNAALGTSDLFGGAGDSAATLDLKAAEAWTPMDKLQKEFDAVGFFLSGHPLDQYERALEKLGVRRFVDFEAASTRGAAAGRLAGIVIAARERRSQKGNKFAFALFSDTSGQFEAVIFSDTLAQARSLLESGNAVLLDVEGERDGEALKIRVQSVKSLDEAVEQIPRRIRILVDGDALGHNPAVLDQLKTLLRPGKGEAMIELRLADYARPVPIVPKARYDLSARTIGRITTVPGVIEVIET
jgi:DNA polymerase-3 subunit alpha